MELGRECSERSGRIGLVSAGGVILFFLCLSIFPLYGQNLALNGNFGLGGGSFEDWTVSHTPGDTNNANYSPMVDEGGNDDPANNPYYAGFLYEESGSGDVLSQDISTIPGDVYLISFYAEDGAGHNFETDFSFGNFTDNLGSQFSIGPGEWWNGWTNFTFAVTATQAESDLSFLVRADTDSGFGVTGVSVTQAPAPDFEGVRAGNTFQITVSTPASYSIMIQASTNMVNWASVYTNTAPFTFTDSCSAYPKCFYRAAMVVQ